MARASARAPASPLRPGQPFAARTPDGRFLLRALHPDPDRPGCWFVRVEARPKFGPGWQVGDVFVASASLIRERMCPEGHHWFRAGSLFAEGSAHA